MESIGAFELGARAFLAAYEDLQSVAGGVVPELTALAEGES